MVFLDWAPRTFSGTDDEGICSEETLIDSALSGKMRSAIFKQAAAASTR